MKTVYKFVYIPGQYICLHCVSWRSLGLILPQTPALCCLSVQKLSWPL